MRRSEIDRRSRCYAPRQCLSDTGHKDAVPRDYLAGQSKILQECGVMRIVPLADMIAGLRHNRVVDEGWH